VTHVVDLPRVRAALAYLDRHVAAHPELRGEAARLAALVDVAAVAGVDVQELAELAAVTARAHEALDTQEHEHDEP
jgi:glutathione S-transferase